MLITDLPVETLDHIAAALDLPIDLVNLGSTCSQLRQLVDPYHTQFRVIRTPIISPIWQDLAENRALAKNVRLLEIQFAEVHGHSVDATLFTPVTPAMYSDREAPRVFLADNIDPYEDEEDVGALPARNAAKNAADLDAERSLVSALKGMSGLVSFRWIRKQSGSGLTLKKLSAVCNDNGKLNHLVTELSRIAPNLEWLHLRCVTLPVVSALPNAMYKNAVFTPFLVSYHT
ncbi:hypothetical protein HYPSUDRAFT_205696 [Hypholoma sublateritium FD-334 SS-4]|uniref:F-box domain-containing protein n=1 Tax=Hypholoma sublateritium (strain FD-334 SS-4) TaxID=945553 RepID=A0A0D2KTZ9_HYPSF|nr:hypothetical protein HYPSUDRAFT_205696 [Hypholoma sublateritium FD-334 SS-4]